MSLSTLARQHWAALRALLVFTVILGGAYPVAIWLIAMLPGLDGKAQGSIVEANGKPVGSSLIGQSFTDADGSPLATYFQSRPSAAGDGYDTMATSASNLGPESMVDAPDKPSLLTLVCTRSHDVGAANGVDGARPFCTGGGVGAVLSVIGSRDASGTVTRPTRVISVNEPCETTTTPFLDVYEGVRVQCAVPGEDYSMGQLVPIRGAASADSPVPADAVTASGSGLDPHISPAYAALQVEGVARARGVDPALVRTIVAQHTEGRALGFMGEPAVNVLGVNLALDQLGE
ncbi:potassium-transporting ATPase subunit C [Mycolicibacterium sediminis]|uniref:Potassium-transporting ATPase KdpC subunit n=1 Tax=Mycolicibacterium sediminis TaxID=1286180 RepID=A0A7I7R060_9MYCO|nr:potassium-transporting ATPase subunit C [Mycolicibacterium sediminis]BBY31607.1 potassium-transporting ATPase KdpC subunit [Mycolicibacterium sediminis]